jgi:hypothetical protein
MAKRGRPPALDETARREICLLVLSGHNLAAAARCVGCAVNTVRNTAVRDANFRRDLEMARREASSWRLFELRHSAMRSTRRCANDLSRERRIRSKHETRPVPRPADPSAGEF